MKGIKFTILVIDDFVELIISAVLVTLSMNLCPKKESEKKCDALQA